MTNAKKVSLAAVGSSAKALVVAANVVLRQKMLLLWFGLLFGLSCQYICSVAENVYVHKKKVNKHIGRLSVVGPLINSI